MALAKRAKFFFMALPIETRRFRNTRGRRRKRQGDFDQGKIHQPRAYFLQGAMHELLKNSMAFLSLLCPLSTSPQLVREEKKTIILRKFDCSSVKQNKPPHEGVAEFGVRTGEANGPDTLK